MDPIHSYLNIISSSEDIHILGVPMRKHHKLCRLPGFLNLSKVSVCEDEYKDMYKCSFIFL